MHHDFLLIRAVRSRPASWLESNRAGEQYQATSVIRSLPHRIDRAVVLQVGYPRSRLILFDALRGTSLAAEDKVVAWPVPAEPAKRICPKNVRFMRHLLRKLCKYHSGGLKWSI
jgi:hypothetical protein